MKPPPGQSGASKAHGDVRRVVAFALATGMHAGALGALTAVRLPSHGRAVAERSPGEIDLDWSEPSQEWPAVALPSPEGAALDTTRRREAYAASTKAEPAGESHDHPSLPEATPSDWSFSPSALTIDPRAAITRDLLTPAPERVPPPDGRPRASTTGGVAEGLAARDVELGLSRGGAVLAAAESATQDSDARVEGSATFDVIVFADRSVSVRLASADGDAIAWARVGQSLARSVDASRVRIPPAASGWRVVVRVEAAQKLADGRAVRSLHQARGVLLPSALQQAIESQSGPQAPPQIGRPPDDVGGDSHEPPPVGGSLGPGGNPHAAAGLVQGIAQRVLPTPAVSANGKVVSASVGVTPAGPVISGTYSLKNIGTPPARVVSGRILSEGGL